MGYVDTVSKALGANAIGDLTEGTNGPTFLLARVDDVDALSPDMTALARLPHAVGVYEGPRGDVVRQRLFAPHYGIPEDPGTGSLAGLVGHWLLRAGLVAPGAIEVHQGAHLGRPCVISVELAAGAPPRVGGACASVARGTFELPLHV